MEFQEPDDGYSKDEKDFLRLNVLIVYRKIPNPIDKFIVMAINECDYTQDEIATILKISQVAVSKRYKNILIYLKDLKTRKII